MMNIQPDRFVTNSLRTSQRRKDICRILFTAIRSADAGETIHRKVIRDENRLIIGDKPFLLGQYKRIFTIAIGKAAVPMIQALHEILGQWITAGSALTKKGYLEVAHSSQIPVSYYGASHPIPDQSNIDASKKIDLLLQGLEKDDLVICLLSGGGSALLIRPSAGISLADLQLTTGLLLSSGADIGEINTIRKHLDDMKGGGLAKHIFPATLVTLILSDVIGDPLDQIASGPTAPDPSTYSDAWSILNKYQILDQIPFSVRSHIQAGIAGKVNETIKPGDAMLDHVYNFIVGNNSQPALASEQAARGAGFHTRLLTTSLQGEASQIGRSLVEDARSLLALPIQMSRPACLIASGETTVTIRGSGRGGRNQELALGAVDSLSGEDNMLLISLATDGEDGPTDAAGAVATNRTRSIGLMQGLDPSKYLANNDAYHYFEQLGDLIKTGPTLTNVNDLVFIFGL